MPSVEPSVSFAKAMNQPHPVADALWHPEEFTFAGMSRTLEGLVAHDVQMTTVPGLLTTLRDVTDADMKEFFNRNGQQKPQIAALTFPVPFSPSQALIASNILNNVESRTGAHMEGVFLFESTSPSYSLDSDVTKATMSEIIIRGHDVGLALAIKPGQTADEAVRDIKKRLVADMDTVMDATGMGVSVASFSSVGVPGSVVLDVAKRLEPLLDDLRVTTPYHSAFQNASRVAMLTTSNGVYKNGHPVEDFAKGDKPFGIVQIIPEWFSKQAMWPLDRLGSLREVDANVPAVRADYLAHVKMPMLGKPGTTQGVPEGQQFARGYRAQRHEMS